MTEKSNRMGRNPFEKKTRPAQTAERPFYPPVVRGWIPNGFGEKVLHWALVDVPAEAFLLGLKTYLLAAETFRLNERSAR